MIAYLTQGDLEAALAKWQRVLHLQDWEITADLVPQTVFPERGMSGSACVRSFRRAAHIRMATLETMDLVSNPNDADMERTLVHELVHLVFSPEDLFGEPPPKHQNRAYEMAVESMARSLVEIDRGATRHSDAPLFGAPR